MTGIISLKDYWMGRDETHSDELTANIHSNASDLLTLVNELLTRLNIVTAVNSGWRPKDVNESIGGAPGSYHMNGQAIDLADPKGRVFYAIIQESWLLGKLGLFMESPTHTKGWVHLDTGKRTPRKVNIFLP